MLSQEKKTGTKPKVKSLTATISKPIRTKGAGDQVPLKSSTLAGDIKSKVKIDKDKLLTNPIVKNIKKDDPKTKQRTPLSTGRLTRAKSPPLNNSKNSKKGEILDLLKDDLFESKIVQYNKINNIFSDSSVILDPKNPLKSISEIKAYDKKKKTDSKRVPNPKLKKSPTSPPETYENYESTFDDIPSLAFEPSSPKSGLFNKKNNSPIKSFMQSQQKNLPRVIKDKSELFDILAQNRTMPVKNLTSEDIKKKTLPQSSLLPKNILETHGIKNIVLKQKKANMEFLKPLKSTPPELPNEKALSSKLEKLISAKPKAKSKGKNIKKKISISSFSSLSSDTYSSATYTEDEN